MFKLKKEQGGINQVVDFMGNPVELSTMTRAKTLLEKAEKELRNIRIEEEILTKCFLSTRK